jgi:hypothetical protein
MCVAEDPALAACGAVECPVCGEQRYLQRLDDEDSGHDVFRCRMCNRRFSGDRVLGFYIEAPEVQRLRRQAIARLALTGVAAAVSVVAFGNSAALYVVLQILTGAAMAIGFTWWAKVSPRSFGRVARRGFEIAGGPPDQSWRWKRRTRGVVLIVIGLVALPSGVKSTFDSTQLVGGSFGGAVLTVMGVLAIAAGVALTRVLPTGRSGMS